MKGAKAIQSTLPDDLLANPVMNRFFEAFLSVEVHVLLRFGKYREILSKPVPTNEVRLPPVHRRRRRRCARTVRSMPHASLFSCFLAPEVVLCSLLSFSVRFCRSLFAFFL
jgi:hypothetical protein